MSEEMKSMFNTIIEEMGRMETRINKRMDERFDKIKQRLDKIEKRIEELERRSA